MSYNDSLSKKLDTINHIISVIMKGKYLLQCLLCLFAILFPWFQLTHQTHTFEVMLSDFEGVPLIGFILIFILSMYSFQRLLRGDDIDFTKRIEIICTLGLVFILETFAYPRFVPGVGGRPESFGTTSLMKFNSLGYGITPLLGYVAASLIIFSVILGLLCSFSLNIFKRLYLYYDSDSKLAY